MLQLSWELKSPSRIQNLNKDFYVSLRANTLKKGMNQSILFHMKSMPPSPLFFPAMCKLSSLLPCYDKTDCFSLVSGIGKLTKSTSLKNPLCVTTNL